MIEYKYDFNNLYIKEGKAALYDQNQEIYHALKSIAQKYKCKITLTYFISKHSRVPSSLYLDFEVKTNLKKIHPMLKQIFQDRYLIPVSLSKGLLDKERIAQDLYDKRR